MNPQGKLLRPAGVALPVLLLLLLTLQAGCDTQATAKRQAENQATDVAANAPSANEQARADKIVVYYFHGDKRCRTCRGIQAAIEDTISTRFAKEATAGVLELRKVNTDSAENAHYIDEFQLTASSMVVVANSNETRLEWQNCPQIWPLARDREKLADYVATQIQNYLSLLQES